MLVTISWLHVQVRWPGVCKAAGGSCTGSLAGLLYGEADRHALFGPIGPAPGICLPNDFH